MEHSLFGSHYRFLNGLFSWLKTLSKEIAACDCRIPRSMEPIDTATAIISPATTGQCPIVGTCQRPIGQNLLRTLGRNTCPCAGKKTSCATLLNLTRCGAPHLSTSIEIEWNFKTLLRIMVT